MIIQVETKQYEEEERNGNYNDEYGEGDISSPLEQFLYELDGIMEKSENVKCTE